MAAAAIPQSEEPDDDPRDWTTLKVQKWLRSQGHQHALPTFQRELVDGTTFYALTEAALQHDLGVEDPAKRATLFGDIRRLKFISESVVLESKASRDSYIEGTACSWEQSLATYGDPNKKYDFEESEALVNELEARMYPPVVPPPDLGGLMEYQSRCRGVKWDDRAGRWRSKYRRKELGLYPTEARAVEAYNKHLGVLESGPPPETQTGGEDCLSSSPESEGSLEIPSVPHLMDNRSGWFKGNRGFWGVLKKKRKRARRRSSKVCGIFAEHVASEKALNQGRRTKRRKTSDAQKGTGRKGVKRRNTKSKAHLKYPKTPNPCRKSCPKCTKQTALRTRKCPCGHIYYGSGSGKPSKPKASRQANGQFRKANGQFKPKANRKVNGTAKGKSSAKTKKSTATSATVKDILVKHPNGISTKALLSQVLEWAQRTAARNHDPMKLLQRIKNMLIEILPRVASHSPSADGSGTKVWTLKKG